MAAEPIETSRRTPESLKSLVSDAEKLVADYEKVTTINVLFVRCCSLLQLCCLKIMNLYILLFLFVLFHLFADSCRK